jgi:hypothetical protein
MDLGEPTMTAILTIELVPRTCWFSNVRDLVSREDWDRIRAQVYRRAAQRCEVCGGLGSSHPVECHEVWQYDEARAVQSLLRMIALCPACHEVKHIGLAGVNGRGEVALRHLAKVNGWEPAIAARFVEEAFALWESRSNQAWALDVSALDAYGIDPTIIADASRASAESRSQAAASVTARVLGNERTP